MTSSDEMLKESLSALMDNQASEIELRRILKQLPEDASIGATWHRYQLASTVMHRGQIACLNLDLSTAISEAIAQEPALSGPTAKPTSHWLRWGGKSSLAASVALAVLIGVQQFSAPAVAPLAVQPAGEIMQPTGSDAPANVVASVPEMTLQEGGQVQSAPDGFALPAPMARTVSSQADRVQSFSNQTLQNLQVQPVSLNQTDWRNDPEVQAQLNQMLLDHANRSAVHGSFGLLPFTRVSTVPGSTEASLNSTAEPAAGKR
ncbi:MAG: hypothetical protein RL497_2824 [Pseudomonadota bacterium]|jgi:sigma-E factor negative regulatory protein RseA